MDPAAIHEQVGRVLRSRTLANKGQLRKLLEILHENMDSQAGLTTELVIQELWPTETKTKQAKDVATEMNRLRHALEAYYREEGKTDCHQPAQSFGDGSKRCAGKTLDRSRVARRSGPPHLDRCTGEA